MREPSTESANAVAPRLVAFDLDGTLLNAESQVSDRTRALLAELAGPDGRLADGHLVVATGRAFASANPRLEGLDQIRWIICDNGASLHDRHRDELVAHDVIGPAANEFVDEVRQRIPGVTIGWGSLADGFAWTPEFAGIFGVDPSARQVIAHDDPLPSDLLKVLLAHPDHPGDELLQMMATVETQGLTVTTSGLSFVEVSAPGIDKSVRLAELCRRLEVDRSETAAFGDAMNDHDMLRWVGTGYAMANASPQIKAVADAVTERTNDDDGVAHTLETIFGTAR